MFRRLTELLAGWREAAPAAAPLDLAMIALLLEIGRADHEVAAVEQQRILATATRVFGLDEPTAAALVARAAQRVETSISLDEFTGVLNQECSLADKRRCLIALWQVALADGRLDRFEEFYLRKICDLLYLSHQFFIQAKLAATAG